jgi:hypothetical protein
MLYAAFFSFDGNGGGGGALTLTVALFFCRDLVIIFFLLSVFTALPGFIIKLLFKDSALAFENSSAQSSSSSSVSLLTSLKKYKLTDQYILFVCLKMFNATFNNISAISWRSVLLVEQTGRRRENH